MLSHDVDLSEVQTKLTAWLRERMPAGGADAPQGELDCRQEYLDWEAIRSGETSSFNAWTGGKLKVAGDNRLYRQLADVITKA